MDADRLEQPHDLLVKFFLRNLDLVADLLDKYLPLETVETLDLTKLHLEPTVMVNSELGQRLSDFRFSTVFKGTDQRLEVIIFLEHQSTREHLISYRMFQYIATSYTEWLHKAESSGKNMAELTFPFPLAVVLYHGKNSWGPIADMSKLIVPMPGYPREVLHFPIYLIDLSTKKIEDLRGAPALKALLIALKAAGEHQLVEEFETIFDTVNGQRDDERFRDWIKVLLKYVFSQAKPELETIDRVLKKTLSKKEVNTMATSWAEEWIMEGQVKGRVEGKVEGEAKLLLKLLEKRFGYLDSGIRETITSCQDTARLESLFDFAISAPSLDAFVGELG